MGPYGMVFLWQFPHFMAIAWMYREDYRRAGYRVLPRDTPIVPFVICQAMIPLLVLVPLSLTPVFFWRAGLLYLATALVLGGVFIYRADRLAIQQSNAAARRLLTTSIVYLPLILIVLVMDRAYFHAAA